jgi:hypothetical protein
MPRSLGPGYLFPIVLLFTPTIASCNTINVGLISFDVLIPSDINAPGVNVFNISNFTSDPASGGFALPPDFPVMNSISFLGSSLTLLDGGSQIIIPLGDLGPGSLSPADPVQFPGTASFGRAVFSATLSQTSFLLSNGIAFVAGNAAFSIDVLPSSGTSLVPGADFSVIAVSDVPEPGSVVLVGTGLATLIRTNRRKKHI